MLIEFQCGFFINPPSYFKCLSPTSLRLGSVRQHPYACAICVVSSHSNIKFYGGGRTGNETVPQPAAAAAQRLSINSRYKRAKSFKQLFIDRHSKSRLWGAVGHFGENTAPCQAERELTLNVCTPTVLPRGESSFSSCPA